MNELVTPDLREKLLENGRTNTAQILEDGNTEDFWPVLKLFFPWGDQTWLISELDPENEDCAFGLADLGMGCPELGYIDLKELREYRWIAGLHVERDIGFKPKKSLGAYAEEARERGFLCT